MRIAVSQVRCLGLDYPCWALWRDVLDARAISFGILSTEILAVYFDGIVGARTQEILAHRIFLKTVFSRIDQNVPTALLPDEAEAIGMLMGS